MYLLNVALTATILIPFFIGVFNYKNLNTPAKVFLILIIIGTVNETAMVTLAYLKIHNLFTLHFYSLAELLLISILYDKLIKEPKVKATILPIMILLLATGIVYSVLGQNLYTFNSIPRALESSFIIGLAIYYFYEMTVFSDAKDPINDGFYFINGSLLFYFVSSFIIFLFSKYVKTEDLFTMYGAHAYINAFCNLIFGLGLWKISKSYSIAL